MRRIFDICINYRWVHRNFNQSVVSCSCLVLFRITLHTLFHREKKKHSVSDAQMLFVPILDFSCFVFIFCFSCSGFVGSMFQCPIQSRTCCVEPLICILQKSDHIQFKMNISLNRVFIWMFNTQFNKKKSKTYQTFDHLTIFDVHSDDLLGVKIRLNQFEMSQQNRHLMQIHAKMPCFFVYRWRISKSNQKKKKRNKKMTHTYHVQINLSVESVNRLCFWLNRSRST